MKEFIGMALIIILVYGVLFIPVGLVNIKAYRALKGEKPKLGALLTSFSPFYALTYTRKQFYGKATMFKLCYTICGLAVMFRCIAIIMLTHMPVLTVYSSFAMVGAIVLFYLFYIMNAIDLSRMFGSGPLQYLICVALTPLAYYTLSVKILPYFASVKEIVDGTFDDSDTYTA